MAAALGEEFGVWALGVGVQGLGFRVLVFWFRVQGFVFLV